MWPMTLAPDPCLARVNHPRLSVQIHEFTGAWCKVSPCCVLEIVACANLEPRFVVADVSFEESKLPCIPTCKCTCLPVSVPIPNPNDSPIQRSHPLRRTPVVGVKCALVVITFDYVYRNSCRRRCVLLKKTSDKLVVHRGVYVLTVIPSVIARYHCPLIFTQLLSSRISCKYVADSL